MTPLRRSLTEKGWKARLVVDDGSADLELIQGSPANKFLNGGPRRTTWIATSAAGECVIPVLNLPMLRKGVEIDSTSGVGVLRTCGHTRFGRRLELELHRMTLVLTRTAPYTWDINHDGAASIRRMRRQLLIDTSMPIEVSAASALMYFSGLHKVTSWWHHSNAPGNIWH